jgi:hypothetical protein
MYTAFPSEQWPSLAFEGKGEVKFVDFYSTNNNPTLVGLSSRYSDIRGFLIIIHCIENLIYVFPEMKLRSLIPISYIHVSVSDLYIHRIALHIWLLNNRQTDPGIYKSLTDTLM